MGFLCRFKSNSLHACEHDVYFQLQLWTSVNTELKILPEAHKQFKEKREIKLTNIFLLCKIWEKKTKYEYIRQFFTLCFEMVLKSKAFVLMNQSHIKQKPTTKAVLDHFGQFINKSYG